MKYCCNISVENTIYSVTDITGIVEGFDIIGKLVRSRIFLEKAQSRGEIEETDFELPKSYVVFSGKSNKGKKSENAGLTSKSCKN